MRYSLAMTIVVFFGSAVLAPAKTDEKTLQDGSNDSRVAERDSTSRPSYRVEAPDLVRLEMAKATPLPSNHIDASPGDTPIAGDYLVGPDGSINLRKYGTLNVRGKTIAEIKELVQKHLASYFDSPVVSVKVRHWNSKVFYVITARAGLDDNMPVIRGDIRRVPITGNDTVMDALSEVTGLPQMSSAAVWVARPASDGFGRSQILPVDYEAITRGATSATNYQLMPGDRVFVREIKSLQPSANISNDKSAITQPATTQPGKQPNNAGRWRRWKARPARRCQ